MSELACFSEKDVKLRKATTCEYCGKKLEPGWVAHVEKGVYDGHWFSRYSCYQCADHIHAFWQYCDGDCGISVEEAFRFFLAAEISERQYWPYEDDYERWQ